LKAAQKQTGRKGRGYGLVATGESAARKIGCGRAGFLVSWPGPWACYVGNAIHCRRPEKAVKAEMPASALLRRRVARVCKKAFLSLIADSRTTIAVQMLQRSGALP